jgi:hypothetical protein
MAKDGRAALEEKALGVAEFRLTGSQVRAAEAVGVPRTTLQRWITAADRGSEKKSGADHELAKRVEQIVEKRRAGYDQLIERAVELQLRDLPKANFRDRTGLIKIIGELRQLEQGKPTSIVESKDKQDFEIERLLEEMGSRERNGASTT